MDRKQIADLVNPVTKEIVGDTGVVAEDLSNVTDVGTAVFNNADVDTVTKKLLNHIGRVVIVNREYEGNAPSILRDGWTYGSCMEKVKFEMPEAQDNPTWQLEDRRSYDPNVFYQPKVSAKFYNERTTFEIPFSTVTSKQLEESFSTAGQLGSFVSGIYTHAKNSMTIKNEGLIMRAINNMIVDTIKADYGNNTLSASSGVKAINLLYLYKQAYPSDSSLTYDAAMRKPEFLRFASYVIGLYPKRLRSASKLFNMGGNVRFTPKDRLHFVCLDEFKKGADVYLQSDVWHNEFTDLPQAETVPFWQGSGQDWAISSTSKIYASTATNTTAVQLTGIIGCMFDEEAVMVTNFDAHTTTNWNPRAEFTSAWMKVDAGYFNDGDENFIVFFAA